MAWGLTSLLGSCTVNVQDIHLKTSNGENWNAALPEAKTAKVYFFLAPECPISINYTKTINAFYGDTSHSDLDMAVIIPGNFYTDSVLHAFIHTYQLEIPVVLDKKNKMVKALNATVTPEVFLLDNKNNEVLYSGKIDNWAMALGVKRNQITEFYLNYALEAFRRGEEIHIKRTKPVGCFIEP